MNFKRVVLLMAFAVLAGLFFLIDGLVFAGLHYCALQLYLALFLVLMAHQARRVFLLPALIGLALESLLFWGSYEWLVIVGLVAAVIVSYLADFFAMRVLVPVLVMAGILVFQALWLMVDCGYVLALRCTVWPFFVNLISVWFIAFIFEKFGTRGGRLPAYRR